MRLAPAIAIALGALSACGASSNSDVELPALLGPDAFGDGWTADDPGPVPLGAGSVAPPCPFDLSVPDIEVTAADSVEFGNDQLRLGVNHTVVALDGTDDPAAAVQRTWEAMDCSESDFEQATVAGLPDGVIGIELSSRIGPFTQIVLISADGSVMSFVIVSGDDDAPLRLATTLAERLSS